MTFGRQFLFSLNAGKSTLSSCMTKSMKFVERNHAFSCNFRDHVAVDRDPCDRWQRRSYVQLIDFSKKLREDRHKEMERQRKKQLYERGELDTSDLDESDVFVDVLSDRYRREMAEKRANSSQGGLQQVQKVANEENEENLRQKETKEVAELTLTEFNGIMAQAQQEMNNGQFYKAQNLLSQCLNRMNASTTAALKKKSFVHFVLAKCFVSKGEVDFALNHFNQCIELMSEKQLEDCANVDIDQKMERTVLIDALYSRAVLHFNCNRFKESLNDYSQCIEVFRKERSLFTSELKPKDCEVIDLYSSALNNRSFLILDNLPSLRLDHVMSENDTTSQGDEQTVSDLSVVASDLLESIVLNNRIGHNEQYSMYNLFNLARCYMMSGQLREAIDQFTKFIAIHDKNRQVSSNDAPHAPHLGAHTLVADCMMKLGQYSDALPHLTICVDTISKALNGLTRKDRSFRTLRKQLASAYMKLAECKLANSNESLERVMHDISKAVECDQAESSYWVNRALFHMFHTKEYEKAVYDFSVALLRYQEQTSDRRPQLIESVDSQKLQYHDVLLLKAMCYECLNQWEEAIAEYTLAVEQVQTLAKLNQVIPITKCSPIVTLLMNTYQSPVQQFLTSEFDSQGSTLAEEPELTSQFLLSRLFTKLAQLNLEFGKHMMTTKQEYDFSKFLGIFLQYLRRAISLDNNNTSAFYHRSKIMIQLYRKREELNQTIPSENRKPNEYYNQLMDDLGKLVQSPSIEYKKFALYNRAVISFKRGEYQQVVEDLSIYLSHSEPSDEQRDRAVRLKRNALLKQGRYLAWIQDALS